MMCKFRDIQINSQRKNMIIKIWKSILFSQEFEEDNDSRQRIRIHKSQKHYADF